MKQFILTLLLAVGATSVFAQEAQSVTQAIHYIKLANTLREVNKSEESLSLLRRALPAVKSKSLYWQAVTTELIGLCHKDLEEYGPAVQYLERARSQYAKLKYVASAWGVNEVIRDISGKNLYAGIQIGTSDVTLAIFKTQYESDFYEKDIRSIIRVPNLGLTADASGSYRQGQVALQACLDTIQRYNIPGERTFIVFSSDVLASPVAKSTLYAQLTSVLPKNSPLHIDTTLTPAREAELFTIGAIPRRVWPTTSMLNMGSTGITYGYFDKPVGTAPKTFHYGSSPVGINTLVNQIDPRRFATIDTYQREVRRLVGAMADTNLVAPLPGLNQRRTVGVSGTIVLALATYLYPEKAGKTAVPVTLTDVQRFRQLALTDYDALIQPNLTGITDLAIRDKAAQDVRNVQNQLTRKQLIAGALLLEAAFGAYRDKPTPKRFVFIRDSDIGWVTGKFLETINYEYESTIAKGALYTR